MPASTDFYQPQITAQGAMAPAGNSGRRVISAFGEAAPALARGFGDAAAVGMQELDDNARAWAAHATSQADVAAAEILEAKKREAADGAPNFKQTVMDEWRKYQDKTMEVAPNNRTKDLMQSHFDAVNESLTLQSDAFQNQESDRWRAKMAEDGVDADARLISIQGKDEIDTSTEKSLGKWAAYYKSLPMEPATRQKLMDATKDKVLDAANRRKISIDPTSYLAENSNARNSDTLAGDPNAPRGIRNNNPGNLRSTAFAGTVGEDDQGYGKFKTPEAGLRAMAKNLIVQQDKHGLKTVESIIAKYAPPNENNTAAYIGVVSAALGVKPNQPINLKDPETLQKMMNVMIKHENGAQPYSPLQIAEGADAALNGKEAKPMNGAKPEQGGRVLTGSTAFNLGTWEQQQKWIGLAETEQRAQIAERKAKVAESTALLNSVKDRMQDGQALPEDEMQQVSASIAASGDPETSKKWLDLQQIQQTTQSMQQLTPAQLSGYINSTLEPSAHRDGATAREAMQLEVGQKLLDTMNTQLKTDPVSWAAKTGTPIAPFNPNDAKTFPARVASAEAISQKYGIPVESALFSQSERQQIGIALENIPIAEKLAFGKRMQSGFGKYFTKAIGQISEKDPVFAQAAFLSSLSPGNDKLAYDILQGQSTLAAEPKLKPADADKFASLSDVGDAFTYMPNALTGIVASADALYVKRVGFSENFDKDAYDTALNDVLGMTKNGTGGIGELNGKKYILPTEFTESDFERGLISMTEKDFKEMSGSGGIPSWGKEGKSWTGEQIYKDVEVRSAGYGQYIFYDRQGKPLTDKKAGNGQYILAIDPVKFKKLIDSANEREIKKQFDNGTMRNLNRTGSL